MSQQAPNQPTNSHSNPFWPRPDGTMDLDLVFKITLQWSRRDPQTDCARTCPICLVVCFTRFDFPFYNQQERCPRGVDCQTHYAVKINQCGHIFGLSCLQKWLFNPRELNETCPLCRVQVVRYPKCIQQFEGAPENIRRGIDICVPDSGYYRGPEPRPEISEAPVSTIYRDFEDDTYKYELAHYTTMGGAHIYRRRPLSAPPLAGGTSSPTPSSMHDIVASPTGYGRDYFTLSRVPGSSQAFRAPSDSPISDMDSVRGQLDETTAAEPRRLTPFEWHEVLEARSSGNNEQGH